MAIRFFGQYLVYRKVLDEEQLVASVDFQMKNNLKLGQLAVREGYLQPAEVAAINDAQRVRDLRFGEAAGELGLLDAERVGELLEIQRSEHIYIGQAAAKLGFAREEIIAQCLTDFDESKQDLDIEGLDLPTDLPHPDLMRVFFSSTQKMLMRIGNMKTKLGSARVESADVSAVTGFAVEIPLTGDFVGSYVVALPLSVASFLGVEFLGEELTSEQDLVDMTREFANVVVGHACARLVEEGIQVEMQTPCPFLGDMGRDLKGARILIATPDSDLAALVLI